MIISLIVKLFVNLKILELKIFFFINYHFINHLFNLLLLKFSII